MNTTMADGASERLDAQIADALFGQPGMSKLDVANRLRELRGNGGALLGSAAYPAAWMWPHPEDGSVRFTADGDVASEAASMGRAVSALHRVPVQEDARPSPAGQENGPWPEIDMILADAYSAGAEGLQFKGIARRAAVRAAVAAFAARQPVGATVKHSLTDGGEPNTAPNRLTELAQPALFYIQDTRQVVGNCPVWWGPDGSGYVTRLDEAGRYTEQEAVRQNRTRETDIPWPCAEIDALGRKTVDCQHMRPRAERLAELALTDRQAVPNG